MSLNDKDSVTRLYQYNTVTGYWKLIRSCTKENAQQWLEIFQADDPKGHYCISRYNPRWNPVD